VSHAGAGLLLRAAEKSGLTNGLSAALQSWRKPLATHDPGYRVGRKVLIRTDGAGDTHTLIEYLAKRSLSCSIGFTLTETMVDKIGLIPRDVWTPAYDSDRQVRDGAWVAELTGLLDLTGWPVGMRVIVGKERPHPGDQLRFTDTDGPRLIAFVTNTRRGQLPDLELRHRRRARCEDRIRNAKDTGLRHLPLHGFDQNRIWLAIVQLAGELIAWTQMLAFDTAPARRWEPKRLRLRLFSIAGCIARHARSTHLRLSAHAPHVDVLIAALRS
jgi:Transposase DDE domain group 1